MKSVILYIGLGLLILTCHLTNAAINEEVSPLLAALSGAQAIYFLVIGRKMQLGIIDARIFAVVLFLLGELIIWLTRPIDTEQLGLGVGAMLMFVGFLWGFCEYFDGKPEAVQNEVTFYLK